MAELRNGGRGGDDDTAKDNTARRLAEPHPLVAYCFGGIFSHPSTSSARAARAIIAAYLLRQSLTAQPAWLLRSSDRIERHRYAQLKFALARGIGHSVLGAAT